MHVVLPNASGNGIGSINFAPTQFQNLISEAAGDSGVL